MPATCSAKAPTLEATARPKLEHPIRSANTVASMPGGHSLDMSTDAGSASRASNWGVGRSWGDNVPGEEGYHQPTTVSRTKADTAENAQHVR